MSPESAVIQQLHTEAADLLQQKKSDEEIVDQLVTKGYERHYAEIVLENVKKDTADKKNFWITFFYGLGFLLLGAALSYYSYRFAFKTGAFFYILFWGVIVTGISIMARAFILFKK
jgi:cytochrome c-type biogenesis protein CcmH/NrfF